MLARINFSVFDTQIAMAPKQCFADRFVIIALVLREMAVYQEDGGIDRVGIVLDQCIAETD